MSPVEALELVLAKEVETHDLYARLAVEHVVVKDIFYFLVNEEEKHKKLIEEKLVEFNK